MVVSNASPLIILAKLSLFDLPRRIFSEIGISHEVWNEVVVKGSGLPFVGDPRRKSGRMDSRSTRIEFINDD